MRADMESLATSCVEVAEREEFIVLLMSVGGFGIFVCVCANFISHMTHKAEALVRKFLLWDGDPTFLEEAREAGDKALALDPNCAAAHTALGLANHLSGHSEDAAREYRLAIQLDAEEWMAYRLLGAIYVREGNFKGASPHLQRAIVVCPTHIASYDHLYTVLDRLERREEAGEWADQGIAAARKHLSEVPDDMDARLHMALLYARLGNENSARRTAEAASWQLRTN